MARLELFFASYFLAFLLSLCQGVRASTLNMLYTFHHANRPTAGLISDSAGNLFGSASTGVFEMKKQRNGSFEYDHLVTFHAGKNSTTGYQLNSLILDVAGNLYGTATYGGINKQGLVFEVTQSNNRWEERVLYAFCSIADCADGSQPMAGLTYAGASSGAPYDGVSPLYGTTSAFSSGKGAGNVFKLESVGGSWHESVLYRFCSEPNCEDGAQPRSAVLVDTPATSSVLQSMAASPIRERE